MSMIGQIVFSVLWRSLHFLQKQFVCLVWGIGLCVVSHNFLLCFLKHAVAYLSRCLADRVRSSTEACPSCTCICHADVL